MNSIQNILPTVKKDYKNIKFIAGETFLWSPKKQTITYTTHQIDAQHGVWALIHELAHAELSHNSYKSDFDLLKLESKAWEQAKYIAKRYDIKIDNDHIQDCLDTYRDWLHKRACCPNCSVVTVQRKDRIYQCFNCQTTWKVPSSPMCRVTRRVVAA